jgi:hypothetical protein
MNQSSVPLSGRHAGILLDANDFEVVVPSNFVDLGVPKPKKATGITASTPSPACVCKLQINVATALHVIGHSDNQS